MVFVRRSRLQSKKFGLETPSLLQLVCCHVKRNFWCKKGDCSPLELVEKHFMPCRLDRNIKM